MRLLVWVFPGDSDGRVGIRSRENLVLRAIRKFMDWRNHARKTGQDKLVLLAAVVVAAVIGTYQFSSAVTGKSTVDSACVYYGML